jgi:anti-sigma regulatory factor (Ser/Thr protein kinase)
MNKKQTRRDEIQEFIVSHVPEHPNDIAKIAADHFGITRQAIHKHLRRLVDEGVIRSDGNTRNRVYNLTSTPKITHMYIIKDELNESAVWRTDIRPLLEHLPENLLDIWQHGFTEMFNNAIDHANGTSIFVTLEFNKVSTEMWITDDGVGIFAKIRAALNLEDERHAVLELSKGKFTTDPDRHSGEGVFFTSRMFEEFDIISGEVHFSHSIGERGDWIFEQNDRRNGTSVCMVLANRSTRTTTEVFDQFTIDDSYSFAKTIIPVRFVQYGDDKLVSRSQAKRLLARLDRFDEIYFDFEGVDTIGQAFADEIFRVFVHLHPDVFIGEIYTNPDIQRMISRVRSAT